MNLSLLESFHTKWQDILVIGKTLEQDGKKYHLMGMTLSDEAKLYFIEPFTQPERRRQSGIRNQRRRLKEPEREGSRYLDCRDFFLGSEHLQVQGGTGEPLLHSSDNYGVIQLFFDMMSAGWYIPEWLRDADWNGLQLTMLNIADLEELPRYCPEMPIMIVHRPNPVRRILEKTVTLHVGKSRSFSFTDFYGDQVQCHINRVSLIDVWKDVERQFNDPEFLDRISPEQIRQAKKHSYAALEQNCPKGMCYIGIEYECSKDLDLNFLSKEFLKSLPKVHHGSSSFFLMRLKPDQEKGVHGLTLKGCVIQTPVEPDTTKIAAELFSYSEKAGEWTETVS